jgi:hypothetical protein
LDVVLNNISLENIPGLRQTLYTLVLLHP